MTDLEQSLRRIRLKVFGSEDPPFSSVADAIVWLEETEETENKPYRETIEKRAAEIESLERKLAELTGCGVQLTNRVLKIYAGEPRAFSGPVGGKIYHLAVAIERLAKIAEADPSDVTGWVLVGM